MEAWLVKDYLLKRDNVQLAFNVLRTVNGVVLENGANALLNAMEEFKVDLEQSRTRLKMVENFALDWILRSEVAMNILLVLWTVHGLNSTNGLNVRNLVEQESSSDQGQLLTRLSMEAKDVLDQLLSPEVAISCLVLVSPISLVLLTLN